MPFKMQRQKNSTPIKIFLSDIDGFAKRIPTRKNPVFPMISFNRRMETIFFTG